MPGAAEAARLPNGTRHNAKKAAVMNAMSLRIPWNTNGEPLSLLRRTPLLANPYNNRTRPLVSRHGWLYVIALFFVVMCGMIAFSEWWAYNKNVPYYENVGKSHAAH